MNYHDSMRALRQLEPQQKQEMPGWVHHLGILTGLEELSVDMLKFLRATMVKAGDKLQGLDGIKLLLQHPPSPNFLGVHHEHWSASCGSETDGLNTSP